MQKDAKIFFKDPFTLETLIKGDKENWRNFVDDPLRRTVIESTLAINEFDPTLASSLNFSNPEAFKAVICPLGLEELRAVVHYELMTLNMLIVATRTN